MSYGTNDTLVRQRRIDFVRTDSHFDFAIGPAIVRTTPAGPIDLVPPYLAGSRGYAIRP